MSIFIYRRASSESARELAESLGGIRLRDFQRGRVRPSRGDYVVCWGEHLPPTTGIVVLNNAPLTNKFTDARTLRAANVPTIEAVREVPTRANPVPAAQTAMNTLGQRLRAALDVPNYESFERLLPEFSTAHQRLKEALAAPVAAPGEWIPRSAHHVGGNDLLSPHRQPDYFVKKENLRREYRVHSFQGRSLRAGEKVQREGFRNPHAWIRSWDGGWRIAYNNVEKRGLRDLAHLAVAKLGLEFGAVDIGEKTDGSLIVLEVNRAPGLEGGTIEAYAKAIRQWAEGTERPHANAR